MPRTSNIHASSSQRSQHRGLAAAICLATAILVSASAAAPASAAVASPRGSDHAVRIAASVPGIHVAARPLRATAPKIAGSAVVGSTLSVRLGTWTSGTHFSYQWLASGHPIAGATHSKLVLRAAQKGKRISVRVAGTRAGYTRTVKTSAATAAVRAAKPAIAAGSPSRQPVSSAPADPGNAVNCPDFATHAQAQAWFDKYYPYYGDVARLDADHDGLACEDLP